MLRFIGILLVILLVLPMVATAGYIEMDTVSTFPFYLDSYDTLLISGTVYLDHVAFHWDYYGDPVDDSASRPWKDACFIANESSTGIVIMGDGGGDDVIQTDSTGSSFFWAKNCSDFTFKDFTITPYEPVDTGETGVSGYQAGTGHFYFDAQDGATFTNINFILGGYGGYCITTINTSTNFVIDSCNFYNYIWGYYSRCSYSASSMVFDGSDPGIDTSSYDYVVSNCTSFTAPHSWGKFGGKLHIFNNYIVTDAHNWYYDNPGGNFCETSVDPFGIALRNAKPGTKVHDNVIRSGTDHEGGGGIFIERCHGTADEPIEIYDNNVDVWNGWNDYEYNNGGWVFGTFSRSAPRYIWYHDNWVRVTIDTLGHAEHLKDSTRAIGRVGNAAKFEFGSYESGGVTYSGDSCKIYNNTFIVRPLTGGTVGYALEFQNSVGQHQEFYNNNFHGSLGIIKGGTENGTGGGMRMWDCNLYWDTSTYSQKSYTYEINRSTRYNYDNIFKDNVYDTNVDYQDIELYCASGYRAELSVVSTYNVFVRGTNGLPVSNADVHIENGYGQTWDGSTSSNGNFNQELTVWYESYLTADSTNFNDFTITVSKGEENPDTTEIVRTIEVSADSKLDTVDLDVLGDGVWSTETVNSLASLSVDSLINDSPGETDTITITYTTTSQTFDSNGTVVFAWSTTTYPSDIADSNISATYYNDTTISFNIVIDGTEDYTLWVSAWVVGATPDDRSSVSHANREFNDVPLVTLPIDSLRIDSVLNDYEDQLDTIEFYIATDTQTLSGNPIVILAWSLSAYPDDPADTTSGGMSFAYAVDSTWLVGTSGISGTETYTFYLTAWVYDETNGLSTPLTASKTFTAAPEPRRARNRVSAGKYTGNLIIKERD